MEFKEIDHLIKKYFDGETSLEEENKIRHFLMQGDPLPEKYESMKAIFLFFNSESEKKSRLKLESIIARPRKQWKIGRISYFAAAACMALVLGFWFMTNHGEEKKVFAYINGRPVENRELAYKEAQKALLLVSKNLNKGTEKISHLSEFDKAMAIVNKD
jgi:hypothetical protein